MTIKDINKTKNKNSTIINKINFNDIFKNFNKNNFSVRKQCDMYIKQNKLFKNIDLGYANNLHYTYDEHNYYFRASNEHNIQIEKLNEIVNKIEIIFEQL